MSDQKLRLASRVGRIQASPTLQVMRKAKEMRAAGVDVIDFGPGEPDFITPDHICDAARRAIDAGQTKYTDSSGMPEIRKAIAASYARRFGTTLGPEGVIVGCGGKQELFNLIFALVNEGDEVVIPSPYWVSFPEQVVIWGGKPVFVELDSENGFRPSAHAIEAACTDRTRVIILNSPSNPTGGVIQFHEMERIVALCRERNIVLVSDETYEFFVYDDEKHVSAASWLNEAPSNIVVVNSVSKTYAMTGWRIGYAIGHPDLVKAAGKLQSHSTSNPGSVSQWAALEAIEGNDDALGVMIAAYRERRAWLVPALQEISGFSCPAPGGAFYVFPRVSDLYGGAITGSNAFADFLLEEARVAVVSGIAFGNDDHIRISYATSMESIKEGVRRIREAVRKL